MPEHRLQDAACTAIVQQIRVTIDDLEQADSPKWRRSPFTSNNRNEGTPEENKATVQGSLAYSGTYSLNGKTLVFKIEASTYPNAEGTEQKRSITLTGDQLKYTNATPTVGGASEAVLKRVK